MDSVDEGRTAKLVRRILLATLALGIPGTLVELLLLEHFEYATQWIPVALLGAGMPVLLAHALRPSRATEGVWLLLMVLFVAAGILGVALHFWGNAEFEREMTEDLAGLDLFTRSMIGATPVLAPGSMAQIGLVGLAWSLLHARAGAAR